MHVKSLSLDFSPELIPYDCFVHPNLICLPRMTSEKTRAEDSRASYRTVSIISTPVCPASPCRSSFFFFLQVAVWGISESETSDVATDL